MLMILIFDDCSVFGIWDLRKMNSKTKEQSPIIIEDFGKPVASAFYSAKGSYVLTTANDNTIRIFDCRKNKAGMNYFKSDFEILFEV